MTEPTWSTEPPTDEVLEHMRRDDALIYIQQAIVAAKEYIRDTRVQHREREYRVLVCNLFDIIDDYERGETESARGKIQLLLDQLSDECGLVSWR